MSNLHKLPDFCFSIHITTGEPILIVKGEDGYRPALGYNPDTLNKAAGISFAQVAAMEIGSMFGWGVPGADPDSEMHQGLTDYPYSDYRPGQN